VWILCWTSFTVWSVFSCVLGGVTAKIMSHSRTLNIVLRCCDYRWPVITPLFPFWGWYYWAEKVKERCREDREACLRHWEATRVTQVRCRPARYYFCSGQTPSSEVQANCISCFSVWLVFSLGNWFGSGTSIGRKGLYVIIGRAMESQICLLYL
jgi:hypothetical protein